MKPLSVAGVLAAGLVIGSAATWLVVREPARTRTSPEVAAASSAPSGAGRAGPVAVTLTPEAIERARIEIAPITTRAVAAQVRLPATIEANGYKEVAVKALAAGRVMRVAAELGTQTRRGTMLAELYSPELSEAERAFITAAASLAAHERQLERTSRLTQIGAASQQELEQAHAEHAAMTSALEGARSRLELLGVPADDIARLPGGGAVTATIAVVAPIDGVVTTREANPGLNVEAGAPLFTVVDLSSVWAVGSVFEQDAGALHEGRAATVRVPGMDDVKGVVTYIDPRVSADTRATRVRVELPNPHRALRLGMYADIFVDVGAPHLVPVVPMRAIQTVGSGPVVYVEDRARPGRFLERPIQTGTEMGDVVEVRNGVAAGDRVVVEGSFFVRAERERIGPAAAAPPASAPPAAPGAPKQGARVIVSSKGFEPDRVVFRAGEPARLTFVRTTGQTCATEVEFPVLKIRRALPLNQEVSVDIVPEHADLAFTCGVNMLKGRVTAQ